MATYRYRAKKGLEGMLEGRIEAHSEKEAVEKLSTMGYTPVHIEPELDKTASKLPSSQGRPGRRIKSREITIFTRELASLLKSGVAILNAISIILEQSDNPHLKYILQKIHDAVKEGATFSSVLAQFPFAFSPLYVAMVRTGEDSGALPEALLRIADYRAKEEETFSRLRMALAYPILMAAVGIGTVVFMFTFVIPRLMGIYSTMGQELPLPTRILISISSSLKERGFWVLIILCVFVLLVRRQIKTRAGKVSWSLFKLHLPLFGNFILKAELARFSRTLELLIKNGIPILKALDIAIPVLENEIIANQLRQSRKDLEQGGSFGRSLKDTRLFPPFMSNLISVGEESGKLDEALAEVAGAYERDTDEAISIMNSLLEPLMILAMGLIVGFIVVAMLLPIFQMNVMAH